VALPANWLTVAAVPHILAHILGTSLEVAMPQVTLYLDEATQALLTDAARADGVSKSRWVAELIRKQAHPSWPPQWLALAGSFADFPLRDDLPEPSTDDVARIGF